MQLSNKEVKMLEQVLSNAIIGATTKEKAIELALLKARLYLEIQRRDELMLRKPEEAPTDKQNEVATKAMAVCSEACADLLEVNVHNFDMEFGYRDIEYILKFFKKSDIIIMNVKNDG